MLIMAVLTAVALPKFSTSSSVFDDYKLYDDTMAALRYAQHSATAMQRTVCVNFPTATQLTLTYDSTYGGSTCSPGLGRPGGVGTGTYTVNAPGAAVYSGASAFNFDRVGRPSVPQTLTAGGRQITIEKETGYVR